MKSQRLLFYNLFILLFILLAVPVSAQQNQGKSKGKEKEKKEMPQQKANPDEAKAYGKNKGELKGRDFGQARSADAKAEMRKADDDIADRPGESQKDRVKREVMEKQARFEQKKAREKEKGKSRQKSKKEKN